MFYGLFFIAVIAAFILINKQRKATALNKRILNIHNQWGRVINTDRNFKQINACYNLRSSSTNPTYENDLDLEKVFAFIDRTTSKPGQQYLYQCIHQPQTDAAQLAQLEEPISRITSDTYLRENVQLQLSKLDHQDAYYLPELFSKPHSLPFSPLQAFYIKTAGVIVITLFMLMLLSHNQVYFLALLAALIANLSLHIISKQRISRYTTSLPQLLKLHQVAEWLFKQNILKASDKFEDSLQRVGKLKNSLSFVNVQNAVARDPSDISYSITELLKIIFLIEPLLFIISLSRINKSQSAIEALHCYVGEMDMVVSIASLRASLPYYCTPQFDSSGNQINAEDLYHPLIEDCVPNSINIKAGQGVLITGSNMSGKTTFIRGLALNMLLAQTLNTCCARTYNAPPLNIHTSINMSDDMEAHKSYFQAEALSVLHIIQQTIAERPAKSLVIIDEIFRGTNTIERIAAAKAVLSWLSRNQCFVIVSTHDLELAELLGSEYIIYSFEELMADQRLQFDYKIKPGLLKNKNGIAILQSLGYPDSIVQDAYAVNDLMREKYKS